MKALLLCALLLCAGGIESLFAQGANMGNPVIINLASGSYNNTRNNVPANGYGNDIGNASDDIYYQFIIPVQRSVTFRHAAPTLIPIFMCWIHQELSLLQMMITAPIVTA